MVVLTEPEIGPSCADLPLTLKVTPLGALDLTSRLAGRHISLEGLSAANQPGKRTGCGVVEIFVEELNNISKVPEEEQQIDHTSLAGLEMSLKGTGIPTDILTADSECEQTYGAGGVDGESDVEATAVGVCLCGKKLRKGAP